MRRIVLYVLGAWLLLCWVGCGTSQLPQGELTVLTENSTSTEPTATTEPTGNDALTSPEESTPAPAESFPDAGQPDDLRDAGIPEEPVLLHEQPPEQHSGDDSPEPQPEHPSEPPPSPDKSSPGQQWIGEPCTRDADCNYNGGRCLLAKQGYPNGHCTLNCTATCPDRAGKPVTFCIEDAAGQGYCVSQCESQPCRAGYACQLRQRFSQSTKLKNVCVPQPANPGKQLRFLHIGDSQSSGSQFARLIVDALRNPGNHCANPKTQNNTVFSYAKVSSASRHWSEPSGSSKDWLCGATKVYTNGTAASDTTGQALCSGITNQSTSIFQKMIANHNANAFLIQLGGNSIGFSESYVKSRIQRMLDQMPQGSLCFWVTPSYGTKLSERRKIEKWTQDTLASHTRISCRVLTSIDEISQQTTCNPFNTSDGVHMTTCGSRLWGQLIIQKMCAIGF